MEARGDHQFFPLLIPLRNEARCKHCHGSTRDLVGGFLIRHDMGDLLGGYGRQETPTWVSVVSGASSS